MTRNGLISLACSYRNSSLPSPFQDGLHTPQISLSYIHGGQRTIIDLQRNDGLLPEKHFLRYQNSTRAGSRSGHVVRNFTKTEVDLCHYQVCLGILCPFPSIMHFLLNQGHVRGQPDSIVALSTCGGVLDGIVFDGRETYFIHPHVESTGRLQDHHYLLR